MAEEITHADQGTSSYSERGRPILPAALKPIVHISPIQQSSTSETPAQTPTTNSNVAPAPISNTDSNK
jgi:hypothetical protein